MRPYYYRILEVDQDASQEEIRRSYRRLVKQWHPDVNRRPGANEQFLRIQKAWQVLGDPVSRENYDFYSKRYTHRSGETEFRRHADSRAYGGGTARAYAGYGGRVYYRTVDDETFKKEEKTRIRDWLLVAGIILLIYLIPFGGKYWNRARLYFFGFETYAEVVSVDLSVVYLILGEGHATLSETYPKIFKVGTDKVIPGGMPVKTGDMFRVTLLTSRPSVNKVDFTRPHPETLDRYITSIYLRWHTSELLDTLAAGSMKAAFLYTLCDSLYLNFGTGGLANLYFAGTPAEFNSYNNKETFVIMSQMEVFRRMLHNSRKLTLSPGKLID